MDDVIYRQEAIDALATECSWTIYDEHGQLTPNGEEILETLKKIPSAQKKGRWMPIIEANENGEPYQSGVYCSECGFPNTTEDNFCSECGADMRGEENG